MYNVCSEWMSTNYITIKQTCSQYFTLHQFFWTNSVWMFAILMLLYLSLYCILTCLGVMILAPLLTHSLLKIWCQQAAAVRHHWYWAKECGTCFSCHITVAYDIASWRCRYMLQQWQCFALCKRQLASVQGMQKACCTTFIRHSGHCGASQNVQPFIENRFLKCHHS